MEKTTKTNARMEMFDTLGQFLADLQQAEIYRLKIGSNPEGLLVTIDGKDLEIRVIQKKENVDYEDDDIKATYSPKTAE